MDVDLKDKNILVVGDIMLDHYVMGEVERISPEAPVPIVHVDNEYSTLGGCGNTVRNIKELGVNVYCLSSIGDDVYGREIIDHLDKIKAIPILVQKSKRTIVKERVIASERKIQMIRMDRESVHPINPQILIQHLSEYKVEYDIIVISDYAKGLITKELMDHLHSLKTTIIVDPKPQNFNLYNKVFMITPNEKEWPEIIKNTFPHFPNTMNYVLLTQGSRGMILIDNSDKTETKISSEAVEVYSLQGAGDTVISIMAVCLSMGWNVIDSAYIANKCAAYVVTQPTTAVVPRELFFEIIKDYKKGII
jgi:rfaE bifunctional protein kinase chain/domain